jgi:hypothetical protein
MCRLENGICADIPTAQRRMLWKVWPVNFMPSEGTVYHRLVRVITIHDLCDIDVAKMRSSKVTVREYESMVSLLRSHQGGVLALCTDAKITGILITEGSV